MIFQITQTYTANGVMDSPIKSIAPLGIGIIYKVEVYFPPGSCGLVRIRMLYNEAQIYPFPYEEYFRGEDNTVSFDDTFLIDQPPFKIVVEGYNLDTLYDHVAIVRFGFESNPEYISRYVPPSTVQIISDLQAAESEKENRKRQDALENVKMILEKSEV